MPDKQYEEAKLVYELFKKSGQPIKKGTLAKLSPMLGLSSKTDELLARLHRLMSGLPTEDEFAAIAVWLGKCRLIHKLEQEQFPADSTDKYQVPDFLAIFDYNGQEIPLLVDVKTSQKETPLTAKLQFSARLYEKLTNYSARVGLPLLIAWKVLGHWALFDIRAMQKRQTAYHIDWAGAWSADLMYLLLGNITVVPYPGVSFTITYRDLGPTDQKVKKGKVHKFEYHSMCVAQADGTQITKLNTAEFILFALADKEEEQSRRGDLLDRTFRVVEEPTGLPSYALLPLMLFQMRPEAKRPKNWYEAIKNQDFGDMSYSQYQQAMESSVGTFVQYVFKMVPHEYPDFLPKQKPGDDIQTQSDNGG